MEEFLALYAEYGMIGVVGCMFVFMVYQNAKRSEDQAKSINDLHKRYLKLSNKKT